MRRYLLFVPVVLAGAATLFARTPVQERAPAWGENPALAMAEFDRLYQANCAGCHGAQMEGGSGPALSPALIGSRTDDQLRDTIRHGRPDAGMPPFEGVLSEAEQWQLVNFLRFKAANPVAEMRAPPVDPANLIVKSAKQTVKLEVVASGLDTPWAVAFLPDGRKLVTERRGRLRIVGKDDRLLPDPVSGTPSAWVRQDGGYLDVAIHPDYRRNGWIYLSYSEVLPGHQLTAEERVRPGPGVKSVNPPSMTVLVRGRVDGSNRWVDQQVIFRAPASLYTRQGSHYGSRFLFDGKGHLFFSLGERGDMAQAQRLDSPLGKIHRINDDGTVPADNPFAKTKGALPTIWSYGHRNPQGLAIDPATGLLWETEHGPVGGDEVNVIQRGGNYGWGVVSMGSQPGIDKRTAPGMIAPVTYYTPAIAPSGITFYTGDRYPAWKGNLFVAGLAGQLRRLEIKDRAVADQEVVLQRLGRTRAVYVGPDGLLYVLVHRYGRPDGTTQPQGWLLRLQP